MSGHRHHREITFSVIKPPSEHPYYQECPTCHGPISKAVVVCQYLDDDPADPCADTAIWCAGCFGAIFKLWLRAADELERVLAESPPAEPRPRLELVK